MFVFALVAVEGLPTTDAPVAVFAMHPESEDHPVSAVTVTPLGNGEAEIRDLHDPNNVYTALLPGAGPSSMN